MSRSSRHSPRLPRAASAGAEHPLERRQRRAYLGLLTFLVVVLAGLLLNDSGHHPGNVVVQSVGLLCALGILVSLGSGRVPVERFTAGAGYFFSLWVLFEIMRALLGLKPFLPSLLVMSALSVLLAVNWLPRWTAAIIALTTTASVAALVLRGHPEALRLLLWTVCLNAFMVFLNLFNTRSVEERVRSQALEKLAFFDPLTGVLNRRGGWTELEDMRPDSPGALILLDIDAFKRINDLLGHTVGDEVLVQVARVLEGVSGRPLVARWGGEEFLLLLPGLELAQAQAVAEDILAGLRDIQVPGLTGVSVSMGLALRSEQEDADALISLADRRMYAVKAAGGNAWRSG